MNSTSDLMKIAFHKVGIVEIRIWVCQESYFNQPYSNMALLSSKLKKKCEYEYYSCLKVKVTSLSRFRLFVTSWTVAHQGPPSMEFSRQEYWSGLPFPSPGDLPNPGTEPGSPALRADALPSEPPGNPLIPVSVQFSHSVVFDSLGPV